MHVARKFNLVTGQITDQDARAHRLALEKNPKAGDNVIFFAPVHGDPVQFIAGGEKMSGHFRRVSGFGLQNENRGRMERQGYAAFKPGTKTLLMLDDAFSYKGRRLDFSHVTPSNRVWPLDRWIAANKGDFITVPVHSAAETIKEIRKLHTGMNGSGRAISDYCFATYGGAVLPYNQFFFGWNPRCDNFSAQKDKMRDLYSALHTGKFGIKVRSDETREGTVPNRAVGMPVLVRVSATKSTREEHGANGIKCNSYKDTPQTTFLVGINAVNPAMEETIAYQQFRTEMVGGRDFYVLASPSVSIDPEDPAQTKPNGKHGWHTLRFVLNDAETQATIVGQYARPESHPSPAA